MRKVTLGTLVVAGALVLATAPSAAADPLVINAGNVSPTSLFSTTATFNISGDAFALSGGLSDGGATICFPCTAGPQAIGLHWGGDMGSGSGQVNGTAYSRIFFAGPGFGVGGTATLPASAPSSFVVTFPFAVSANSAIWGYSDAARTNQLFALNLTGSGTAVMGVNQFPGGSQPLFGVQALSFNFTDGAVAPTPEPASFLLLGTAMAGVFARRRWRTARAQTGAKVRSEFRPRQP